jgi:hypothetical protein
MEKYYIRIIKEGNDRKKEGVGRKKKNLFIMQ